MQFRIVAHTERGTFVGMPKEMNEGEFNETASLMKKLAESGTYLHLPTEQGCLTIASGLLKTAVFVIESV